MKRRSNHYETPRSSLKFSEINDLNWPSNGPLVTIVTTSFKRGRFIRETTESVLSQDYPNLEYIVIDGGPTDEMVSILEPISKLKYDTLSVPLGRNVATGLLHFQGFCILFEVDASDSKRVPHRKSILR